MQIRIYFFFVRGQIKLFFHKTVACSGTYTLGFQQQQVVSHLYHNDVSERDISYLSKRQTVEMRDINRGKLSRGILLLYIYHQLRGVCFIICCW